MNPYKKTFLFFALTCGFSGLYGQPQPEKTNFKHWLSENHCQLSVRLNKYDYSYYNVREAFHSLPVDSGKLVLPGVKFDVLYSMAEIPDNADTLEVTVVYHCTEGSIDQASLSVDLNFSNWSPDNFVLMPGVVYDGNKPFRVWKSPDWYPSIGFQSPVQKRGFWFLTDQGTHLGDIGIDIEENHSRTEARILLTATTQALLVLPKCFCKVMKMK